MEKCKVIAIANQKGGVVLSPKFWTKVK